ncbi:MAG: sensor histidine kinase [Cyanobacteria bacterium P01_A01_bin.84]
MDLGQRDNPKGIAQSDRSICRAIKYTEWLLLIIYFILTILEFSNSNYSYEVIHFYDSLIYLVFITCLSFIFPINRPEWQRKLYIFLEIFSTILMVGLGEDYSLIFYLILAKSCFLLTRKQVILTILISIICWNIAFLLYIPGDIEFQRNNAELLINQFKNRINNNNDINRLITIKILTETAIHLAAMIFVFLLCSVTIAEQKSRHKAEQLAKEVEVLAANLERTRIAREIHDSLGHYLTSLDIQLELAQRLYQQDTPKAVESVNIAKNLANQCLSEVRRSVQTIRQPDFNLNEALNNLIEMTQINQSFSVQVNLNIPKLPVQTSHQIYCIIQEGLTNIQKHANATLVNIKSQSKDGAILLELTDNGQGFNITSGYKGFGLRGMHERANILGGELKVYSTIGKGTKIQFWMRI